MSQPKFTCLGDNGIVEMLAKAKQTNVLLLSTSDKIDLYTGKSSPVSYLNIEQRAQLLLDGHLFLLIPDVDYAMKLLRQTVGDDGPTELNPYDGPHKVYGFLAGPEGGISENT